MRRSVISAGLVLVLVACIGSDPTPAPGPTTTPPGTPPTTPPGTPPTTPPASGSRSINCDATLTCTGTNKCCGVGTDWINASCKDDCGGAYALSCDDAKDCDAGQVCCYTTDGGARATASFCALTCRAAKQEHQLCALGSSECKSDVGVGTCSPLTQFSPAGLAHCT